MIDKKISFLLCCTGIIFLLILAAPVLAADTYIPSAAAVPDLVAAPVSPSGSINGQASVQMMALPLTFIPNQGQYDPAVSYMVTGPTSQLFFTPDSILITTNEQNNNNTITHVIRQAFPGAAAGPAITGENQLPGTANFFIGNDPSKWHSNVTTYGAVVYHDLYPGIDLRYNGTTGTLKREFVVTPGANPSVIRLHYEGADTIALGDLGFDLGYYDPAYPLVIDPALVFATYLGGAGADTQGYSIATDTSGNIYVTGNTATPVFPATSGSYNYKSLRGQEVFVTKLNPDGSGLVY